MEKIIEFLRRLLADEEIDTNETEAVVMQLPHKEQVKVFKLLELTTYSSNFDYGYPSHLKLKSYNNFARRILEGFLQECKEKEDFIFSLFKNYLASKQDYEDYEDNEDNVISLFA